MFINSRKKGIHKGINPYKRLSQCLPNYQSTGYLWPPWSRTVWSTRGWRWDSPPPRGEGRDCSPGRTSARETWSPSWTGRGRAPAVRTSGRTTRWTSTRRWTWTYRRTWGGLTSTAARWLTRPTTPSVPTPGGAGWTTPGNYLTRSDQPRQNSKICLSDLGWWWLWWPCELSVLGRRSQSTTTTVWRWLLSGTKTALSSTGVSTSSVDLVSLISTLGFTFTPIKKFW